MVNYYFWIIDSSIVLDELLLGHFVFDFGGVQIGIQHDYRVGQHVGNICICKQLQTAMVFEENVFELHVIEHNTETACA